MEMRTKDSLLRFQAKIDGRSNFLRRSVIVVEGDAAVTKEGGIAGDPPFQGPTRTEPLEKIVRSLHREVTVDAAEGPGIKTGGIVIEEVIVPLDLSSSVGQSTGIDQRPIPGRFGGVTGGPNSPAHFIQHSETGFVRLPDICSTAAVSLRRVSSELPLYLQRERERKQEQAEVCSRGTFSSSSSSSIDYDPDSRPLPMGDHRGVKGPSTSGGEGPLKRSMPSTTTLSSGSSHNVAADSRRPSKIQLTECSDNLMVPGGSTTTRQYDDVFLRPVPKQTSRREDRHPPSTIDTARDRQSSLSHSRNGDSAKNTVPPHVTGLSEAALRILDEINLTNDITRVQNNLERFQRTTKMAQTAARPSLQQAQQPIREKKYSLADAGARQRRPPAAAAVVVAGGKGLMRTSKSQPNLIRDQRLQQRQQPYQQQQSVVRNPVNGSRNARKAQPFKSDDLEDEEEGDYDEDDERTETLKRERIVRWLIGANDCAEPPPCPTVIEEDRPTQTDNAIHIVYTGE